MHRHDHMPPCLVMLLSSKLVKKKEHFGKGSISTMTPNTTNFNNKNTNLGNRCLHLQQSLHPCLATKTLPSPKIWRQAGSQIPLMPFFACFTVRASDQAQTFLSPFPSNHSNFFSHKSIKTYQNQSSQRACSPSWLKTVAAVLLLDCSCQTCEEKKQQNNGKSRVQSSTK